MADSSDAFFNDFKSTPTKAADNLNLTTKIQPRQQRSAPTARSATAAGSSSKSYYSSSSTTVRKPPPPPPKPRTSGAVPSATASNTTSTASTTSSTSYYGGAYQTPAASSGTTTTTNPYIQSAHAAQTSTATYPYSSNPAPEPYSYGAATPAAAPAPQVMNPYILSTQAPGGNGLSGSMDSSATFSGRMDMNASTMMSGPMDTSATASTFIPTSSAPSSYGTSVGYNPAEFEDEPPLLEELGINVEHIGSKMRSVALPFQRFGGNMDATVIQDADLAGPIALALLLGGELMFSGKLQFGYIYGFGLFGCVSMTLVLNFMSPTDAISFWTVTSILGYSLLPVNILAAAKLLVVNLGKLTTIGRILGILTVLWCTVSSTRLMEQGCGMRNQRYLIAYPIGLLYTAFVMITIF